MVEIGPTSPVTHWPSTKTVNPSHNGRNQAKQQKHKRNNNSDDVSSDSPDDSDLNSKKKSPDSRINSHIDEYA